MSIFIHRLFAGLVVCLCFSHAQAALVEGNTLRIDPGSRIGMEVSPGSFIWAPVVGVQGIRLGTSQPPPFFPSPGSSIDYYDFMGTTGRDYTTSPTYVLSADSNTASIDFSGWIMDLDGLGVINMGTGGTADVICSVDCGLGDSYSLLYNSIVPVGHPSGFGGVAVTWELTGYVVPLPGAFWLLLSGAGGLFLFRRKNYE